MKIIWIIAIAAPLLLGACMGGSGSERRMDIGGDSYDVRMPTHTIVDPPRKPRKRPKRKPRPHDPPADDCVENQTECFQSKLSKEPGGVHGRSRCQDCMDKCVAQGEWPLTTWYNARCDWWSYLRTDLAGVPRIPSRGAMSHARQ
jgi:hypothetical protein